MQVYYVLPSSFASIAKYLRGGVAQVVARCALDRANERGLLHQQTQPPLVKYPFLCPAVDAIFTFLQPAWVKKHFFLVVRPSSCARVTRQPLKGLTSRGEAGTIRKIANLADTLTGRFNTTTHEQATVTTNIHVSKMCSMMCFSVDQYC